MSRILKTAELELFDENGELYSQPGSDGCDYVDSASFERVQFANFYTRDVEEVRQAAFSNPGAKESYENWFKKSIEAFPSVYHYSWYDLERKIKTYKNYWSQHWQSLYNIDQEDNSENNMFFNKSWNDVSDKEISELANKLKEEMGGWIFHQKVDFSKPTPHMTLERKHPITILEWLKK